MRYMYNSYGQCMIVNIQINSLSLDRTEDSDLQPLSEHSMVTCVGV